MLDDTPKTRRNILIPVSIDQEMKESGIVISEWVTNAWLDSKFSVKSIENQIEKKASEIDTLKVRLKANKQFVKQMNTLTDKKEIKLLQQLDEQIMKCGFNPDKEAELYGLWKNKYMHYFKIRMSVNMVKHKYELYKKQVK